MWINRPVKRGVIALLFALTLLSLVATFQSARAVAVNTGVAPVTAAEENCTACASGSL